MKSLQVLTPKRECIFNCPFCISKTHVHDNMFENNYENNYELWENNFIKILKNYEDLKTIVITGTNEPMQDICCIEKIIEIVREHRSDIKIELQTRYYIKNQIYKKLDIVAFSIDKFNVIKKIDTTDINARFVILLTDDFNQKSLYDIIDLINNKDVQITFKSLHYGENNNKITNWIKNHKIDSATLDKLRTEINNYRGILSIRIDENCMDSKGRYMVFREDGNLYLDFYSKDKEYINEQYEAYSNGKLQRIRRKSR